MWQIDGFKFRRQQPLDSYIVDFVCFERKLFVELDGGQHAEQIEYDLERDAWLRSQGFFIERAGDRFIESAPVLPFFSRSLICGPTIQVTVLRRRILSSLKWYLPREFF